ncbi:glycosyltransferase family 4 protein [Mucilaginibacter gilvus]|uniref:Glycosyltransferase n=1 Tax=Mucilaginibacter gilvus TaxID=2305909 RepID=A0A444MUP6_9SPHI|nr:glycosyltransferase family 4 protein [Mucilaginibacter gilvus]RWY57342.1 glycosyltransferase [Mucilaginibacter gilvus]
MRKLAIVTTHPIQYYAPVFQLLAQRGNIDIKVFYTWSQSTLKKNDPGFGRDISWDIPLLDGYAYEFIENTAQDPGSHHSKGIINPGLIPAITGWQADAVMVIGWAYKSHLGVLKYFKNKITVLFRGDSTLLDEQWGLKNLLRFLYLRWVYRHVDYALYPGKATKAYFEKYGLKKTQLVFAPHAVDNARFAADRQNEARELRTSLAIKDEDILILFAGKFEDKKDPLILIDSFLSLAQSNLHLLMVGNGVLEERLKQKANGHTNVHFMDFQNQSVMPVVYQACNLLCLPSRGPNETWGLAVNEAMACNKAVLVSNKTGCAADLITPGHNGNVFTAENTESLRLNLAALCTSKEKLRLLGEASGEIIAGWNFTKIAQAIETTVTN